MCAACRVLENRRVPYTSEKITTIRAARRFSVRILENPSAISVGAFRNQSRNPPACRTPRARPESEPTECPGGAPHFATSREIQLEFVNVTPAPGLAWLDRFHDGVFGVMEVFGGMFIF
jgi:hypothetical protein